jgi:hypothetical protein
MPFPRLLIEKIEVEGEKSPEKFTAGGKADGVARLTALVLVKAVLQVEIIPAIAGKNGHVHFHMERPQPGDIRVGGLGIMEEVVGFGETDLAVEHDLTAVIIIGRT